MLCPAGCGLSGWENVGLRERTNWVEVATVEQASSVCFSIPGTGWCPSTVAVVGVPEKERVKRVAGLGGQVGRLVKLERLE